MVGLILLLTAPIWFPLLNLIFLRPDYTCKQQSQLESWDRLQADLETKSKSRAECQKVFGTK